jgi:Na+-driven multidrug efflux pump
MKDIKIYCNYKNFTILKKSFLILLSLFMTKKTKLPLLEMPIGKALLILSIPIVITNMLQVAYQFADAYWVGRL